MNPTDFLILFNDQMGKEKIYIAFLLLIADRTIHTGIELF